MSELALANDGLTRWASVLAPAREYANVLAETEFVPGPMRGRPEAITAAIMYGDELGVGPMQALASIHVIDGRPTPSAELMRALILRAGHSLSVPMSTGEVCRVAGLRAGRPENERLTVEWTTAMARSAGLLGRQNWQRYPRAMLLARATADLARAIFPDVVKGLGYVADGDDIAGEWDAVPVGTTPPTGAVSGSSGSVKLSKSRAARRRIPSPPKSPPVLATPENPASDGSVDIPLPELAPDGEPEPGTMPRPGLGAEDATPGPPRTLSPRMPEPGEPELPGSGHQAASTPHEPPVAPLTAEWDRPRVSAPSDETERSRARLRRMFAAYGALDIPDGDNRDVRLAMFSAIVGRPVPSSATLSRHEVYAITGACADIQSGALSYVIDDEGAFLLRRTSEAP